VLEQGVKHSPQILAYLLDDDLVLAGDVFLIQGPVEFGRDGLGLRERPVEDRLFQVFEGMGTSLFSLQRSAGSRGKP
jgi:glyoxylase-like metal-dependent hydrolase (beta-lactamase superfamily II)